MLSEASKNKVHKTVLYLKADKYFNGAISLAVRKIVNKIRPIQSVQDAISSQAFTCEI